MPFAQHPIVAKLVTDPGATPRVTVLNGYVGNAGKAHHVRIYTSPALDSYLELPEESVKHVAEGATPSAPNTIWVDSHAVVTAGPTAPQPEAAAFLAGDIATRHLSAAGMGQAILQPTPTAQPTHVGCVHPTPTAQPTHVGCVHPTPTAQPTYAGCVHPTPTAQPTYAGCVHPTPTAVPTHQAICLHPTPTAQPTYAGCLHPTPTAQPTHVGCVHPTPTAVPTHQAICAQ